MGNYDARPSAGPWSEATERWLRLWTRLATNVLESQRATASAFGLPAGTRSMPGPGPSPVPSMSYAEDDWTFERSVDTVEEVRVGDTVAFSKRITDEDVRAFARASGDTNRLHLDETFARGTRFGGRIVHGTLVVGLVSAALARLPGVTVYISQDVRYLRPVEIGDRLSADCEVVEVLGEGRYRLLTTVLDGEAVVLVDELPDVGTAD